ncbi:receptor-type tyrosine-protein phosphatase F-like [Amphiura filiformis]|uniref:receptor-type tyrosine-protein phosphatase F-like n=1 Tax=Amphiura filiformis TaxID=82378 RepID=UPI003B214E39
MQYKCECLHLFYGVNCELMCICNNGTCKQAGQVYVCDCPMYYEGDQCEIDRRPACVTNISAIAISEDEICLSWDQSRDGCLADKYEVNYELINGDQCNAPITDSETLPMITGNKVILNMLIPYSTYRISVVPIRCVEAPGLETWVEEGSSLTIEIDTLSDVPILPPANVQVTATDRMIDFTWDLVPCGSRMGAHNTYRFEFEPYTPERRVLNATTPRTGFTRPQVKCNTEYTFRVAAVTNTGTGPFSETLRFTTDLNSDPFSPDSIVQVLPISPTSVNVNWRPNDCVASAFTVEYRLINQDQCLYDESRPVILNSAPTQGGKVTVGNLIPFSSYEFRVSAQNSDGERVGKVATFTTFSESPTGTPQNLQLVSATRNAVAFTWNQVPCGERRGSIQNYVYELLDENGEVIRSNLTSLTTVTAFHLEEDKEYSFRVAAINSAGQGSFTTELTVSTTMQNYECDDIDNPCPFGLYPIGGVCEVVKIIIVNVVFARIDDMPAVFTPSLSDKSSTDFSVLSCRIELQMEIIFLDYGILDAEVLNLYDSVAAEIILRFHLQSSRILNDVAAVDRINEVAGTSGDIGDQLVLKRPFTAEDICPFTYCENGGTCVSQGPYYPGICQCPDSFEGPRCETAEQSDNTALIIGFSVGGGVLLLLLLAACLLAFCVLTRRKREVKENEPEPAPYLIDPYTQTPPWSFGPLAQTNNY